MSLILVIFSLYSGKLLDSSLSSFSMVDLFCKWASSLLYPSFISTLFILIMSPSETFLSSLMLSVQSTTRISPVSSASMIFWTLPSFPFFVVNALALDILIIRPVILISCKPVSNSDILRNSLSFARGTFSSSIYSPTIILAISSSSMKLTSS